ncbi:MAG: hypothetical protein I3274_05295 [Candidatus Moeniiplasma glomeromycotorum]|nr:hypothetical protein [Candidatus Moeniiplasma glomeromycotorum]
MSVRKKNIWKSLLVSLIISNILMVVSWVILTAFGYTPHYWLSFCLCNAIVILAWLFQVLIERNW